MAKKSSSPHYRYIILLCGLAVVASDLLNPRVTSASSDTFVQQKPVFEQLITHYVATHGLYWVANNIPGILQWGNTPSKSKGASSSGQSSGTPPAQVSLTTKQALASPSGSGNGERLPEPPPPPAPAKIKGVGQTDSFNELLDRSEIVLPSRRKSLLLAGGIFMHK